MIQPVARPGKSQARGQGPKKAGGETAGQGREKNRDQARGGPATKPQAKDEKKPETKPAAVPAPPPADDPAKLKQQVAALEKEVAALKLKVAMLDLEKLGAIVTVDKTKDGKEIATVNILKKWSGDKDSLNLLKNVPNLQVVNVDNGQVNDAAVAPLKDLMGLSSLTLMSPQVTDAGARSRQRAFPT